MGLFDKLMDSAAKLVKEKGSQIATGKIKESINNALEKQGVDMDKVKDAFRKDREEERPAPAAAPEPEQPEYPEYVAPKLIRLRNETVIPLAGALGSDEEDRGSAEDFADVLSRNFPGLEVLTNQPLSAVTDRLPERAAAIDVLVRRNGAPAVAIVLVRKNGYKKAAVINTMNACEEAGVPALRFMKEFSNEPAYVAGRVKALL